MSLINGGDYIYCHQGGKFILMCAHLFLNQIHNKRWTDNLTIVIIQRQTTSLLLPLKKGGTRKIGSKAQADTEEHQEKTSSGRKEMGEDKHKKSTYLKRDDKKHKHAIIDERGEDEDGSELESVTQNEDEFDSSEEDICGGGEDEDEDDSDD